MADRTFQDASTSRPARARTIVIALTAVVALALAACGDSDDDGALDLDTLQASTDAGTLQAAPLDDTFVGAVDDDLFIGVSVDGDEATVYLCDGEDVSAWLSGPVDADEPTRLGGFEDGASVVFAVQDDSVSGSVRVAGRPAPQPFEAVPASGDAGLYRAEASLDGVDHVGGWVVLDDGRQRGLQCVPIPCCGPRFCWICGCMPL